VRTVWAPRLPETVWTPGADLLADWRVLAAGVGREAWTVEVAWVPDAVIADLNGRYRGRHEVTDVLSFSELAPEGEGTPDLPAGAGRAAVDLWFPGGDRDDQAGSLVLAPRFVERRCRERGWDIAAELRLLVAHGLLHVVGWEHDTPARRRAMRRVEEALLAGIGWPHPLSGEEES